MIEFIDLKAQQALLKEQIDAGIQRVLSHGQYILGPEVDAFEAAAIFEDDGICGSGRREGGEECGECEGAHTDLRKVPCLLPPDPA